MARGFRDRIVGRDLVIGVAGGLAAQFIGSMGLIFGFSRQFALTADPILRLGEGPFPLRPLLGPHFALGQVSKELFLGLVGGFLACLMFVFVLRMALRKDSLAALAVVLFFAFPSIVRGDFPGSIVIALWVSLALFMLFRFGVLTVVVGWVAWQILAWPIAFNYSTPRVDIGFFGYALVAAVAFYGTYVVRTAGKWLEDRSITHPIRSTSIENE